MGGILGMIISTGMVEWWTDARLKWRNLWNANWNECRYVVLECWNSGGCAGLRNLYIETVVVMIDIAIEKL